MPKEVVADHRLEGIAQHGEGKTATPVKDFWITALQDVGIGRIHEGSWQARSIKMPTDQICLLQRAGIKAARGHSAGAIIGSDGDVFSQDLAQG